MSENFIKVKVQLGILKPLSEVFEAIINPDKMNKYFITTSTGKLESGKSLTWTWEDYDTTLNINVKEIIKDKLISFNWKATGIETLTEIELIPISKDHTLIKVRESEWQADSNGATKCMGQTEGWTHFLCCLKAYLEYKVNLRAGELINKK